MRETKMYCDCCGKELTHVDDYIDIEISIEVSATNKCTQADLCNDCAEKLNRLIGDFVNKDVTP